MRLDCLLYWTCQLLSWNPRRPTNPELYSVKGLPGQHEHKLEIYASSWSEESGADDYSAGERLLPDIFLPASEEERIYKTVWMVARAFGFQVFNLNPKPLNPSVQWTPATAFVATDHLISLLRDGWLRMLQQSGLKSPDRPDIAMAQCVAELHSNIFHSYEVNWCKLVSLQPRPRALTEYMAKSPAYSAYATHTLLCDLSLYFLMWTEAANVRHMSEASWFLFWCCSHTPAYVTLASTVLVEEALDESAVLLLEDGQQRHNSQALKPPGGMSLRDWRVHCRNNYQALISSSQAAACHAPGQHPPSACFPINWEPLSALHAAHAVIEEQVAMAPLGSSAFEVAAGALHPAAVGAVRELAKYGDGGFWCSHIITPLFLLLAHEMDALAEEDSSHRLGYDDVNESLCSKERVHSTLKLLGVTREHLKGGTTNSAFAALAVWIGSPRSLAPLGGSFQPELRSGFLMDSLSQQQGPGGPQPQWFVADRAAAFWSVQVARKTFVERRSWWAVYRAYHRVFMLNLVAFHLMMAQSLSPQDWRALSSAIITHAFLNALERYSNWLVSRHTTSVSQEKDKRQFGVVKSHQKRNLKVAKAAYEADPEKNIRLPYENPRAIRILRGLMKVEGSPVLGLFGFLEWWLLAIAVAALYGLQYGAPQSWQWRGQSVMSELQYVWKWVAVGYPSLFLLHTLLTTRPGYCISLSDAFCLPSFIRASSCRPRATYWLAGDLGVGFGSWLLQAIAWLLIMISKWAFEFFLISRPLSDQIRELLNFNNCDSPHLGDQCINLSWLLVVVTVSPFVFLVMVDGMIFYHAYLSITCILAYLLRLDCAQLPEWDELVAEFHRAPGRWWKKCVSSWSRAMLPAYYSSERARQARASLPEVTVVNSVLRIAATPSSADTASAASTTKGSAAGSQRPTSATRSPPTTAAASKLPHMGTLRRVVNSAAFDPVVASQWGAFCQAWNALVSDLREADLLNDTETRHCQFTRLHEGGQGWSAWEAARMLVSPVVLPSFFYAGQVQRVVDTGSVHGAEEVALEQLRNLALLLAADLGLLSGQQATAVQSMPVKAQPTNAAHMEARARMLPSAVRLVEALLGVSKGNSTPTQAAKVFCDALKTVTQGLEVECRAAGLATLDLSAPNLSGAALASSQALNVLLDLQEACKHTDELSRCLEALRPSAGRALPRQLVQVLHSMLTTQGAQACPSNSEARRILATFLNSLSLGGLNPAPALLETRSLTVLTPLYAEDVMYSLAGAETAVLLGMGGEDPVSAGKNLPNLLLPDIPVTGNEERLSLLSFLRNMHPVEWDNFRERVLRQAHQAPLPPFPAAAAALKELVKRGWLAVTENDFRSGGPLEAWAMELQLWASYRAQVLARTARGMVCAERALKVLAEIEFPQPLSLPDDRYKQWLNHLSKAKFTYVVAAQMYGKHRNSSDIRDQWMAHCIESLLERHSCMRVAFLDASGGGWSGSSSVLIRHSQDRSAGVGTVEELYRVRLPHNPYTGRGIVVGEGKPENQNHATIFAFGEALQTIDMNQDGCLAEALKTRNLLAELGPDTTLVDKPYTTLAAQAAVRAASDSNSQSSSSTSTVGKMSVLGELERLRVKRSKQRHTAICGFKEWIFSHKAGALASFAAATEYAFATVIQRDMARGNVRLHYGHPDVFDKLHCMTRGGLSKATRGLHVSEDVMGGLNHTLRGAKIKYTEAISCGKGRDMGFNSILTFETKISCGNGEVLLTRDMARLAPRMDIFRLLHFYHSGLGYFVTARLMMLSIYTQALSMAVVALAGYGLASTNLQLLIQIGLVSSLPYLSQLIVETGIINAILVFMQQIISGNVAFSIFRMQTTANAFAADVTYGGANYLASGRGFAYRPSSFVQLYASYGRSHLFLGYDLGLLAVVVAANFGSQGNYGALMWGIWLVAASLLVAPFWFNPLSFNMKSVEANWKQWRLWLKGEVDQEVQASWHTWNRRQLQRVRDDQGRQEAQWMARIQGLLFNATPHVMLAFVAATWVTEETTSYLLLTMGLWIIVAAFLQVRLHLLDHAYYKTWTRFKTGSIILGVIAAFVVYVVLISQYWSNYDVTVRTVFLTLYMHLSILLALHAAATQLFSGLSLGGGLVDSGFWVLDCVSGTLLLALIAVLSIGGLLEKLQIILLFNSNFARCLKDSRAVRSLAMAMGSSWQHAGKDVKMAAPQDSDQAVAQQMNEAATSLLQAAPSLRVRGVFGAVGNATNKLAATLFGRPSLHAPSVSNLQGQESAPAAGSPNGRGAPAAVAGAPEFSRLDLPPPQQGWQAGSTNSARSRLGLLPQ